MTHRLQFLLGIFLAIPLLPLIIFQGNRIKKLVPKLPEAKDPNGLADFGFDRTVKVLFLGESTVAGVGVDTHEEGFPGSSSRELARLNKKNIDWKVVARSGYTAKRVQKKLLIRIGDFKPDLIVLGLGGNDAFTLNTPWNWRKDVSKLINALKTVYPDSIIVFTNMPPIKEFPAFTKAIKLINGNLVEILGKELSHLISEFRDVYYASDIIRVEDWIHLIPENESVDIFFSDGVHPSKLTYQTWGREFACFIHKSNINL